MHRNKIQCIRFINSTIEGEVVEGALVAGILAVGGVVAGIPAEGGEVAAGIQVGDHLLINTEKV